MDIEAMLADTRFEETELEGVKTYHNVARGPRHYAMLNFTRFYEDPRAAQEQETLLNLALSVAQKGTTSYPSQSKLARALDQARIPAQNMYTNRDNERLTLCISGAFPIANRASIGLIADITDEMFDEAIGFSDDSIFSRAKTDVVNEIEGEVSDHDRMAVVRFVERYFPTSQPLDDQARVAIVRAATPSSVHSSLESHITQSTPILLSTGEYPLGMLAPLARTLSRARGEEPMRLPRRVPLNERGRSHTDAPCSQVHIYDAFSFDSSSEMLPAMKIAAHALGGDWQGPLWLTLRDKHHLVYNVNGLFEPDNEIFCVNTQSAPKNIDRIIDLIGGVIATPLPTERIEHSRAAILRSFLSSEDVTCDSPIMRIGRAFREHVSRVRDSDTLSEYLRLQHTSNDEVLFAASLLNTRDRATFTYGGGQ